MTAEHQLREHLNKRELKGNLRSLNTASFMVDFFSNDYLGLARSQELWQLIRRNYDALKYKSNGATGSRLLSGNSAYCEQLESYLASIFKAEAVLLFNSGYSANQAVLSSVPQKGDTIIYDENIHACIKEGARLSFARRFSFKHNDAGDLKNKLDRAQGNIFVVIESIYSMDGDHGQLKEILETCKEYEASLIVDEAHSTGVLGENGNGLACNLGLEKEIFLRIYTFGKGMGVHGACVAGSKIVKDYLVNFARSFIYTTALPAHSLVSIRSAFDYLKDNEARQDELKKITKHFDLLTGENLFPDSGIHFLSNNSAIKILIVPGNEKAKQLALAIQAQGFDVRPILSPTVRAGEERIRVCLHAFNTIAEIDKFFNIIKMFYE